MQQIGVDFSATNVDVNKTKIELINLIGIHYGFQVREKNIDTITWILTVTDTMLLNKNTTISVGKKEGMSGGSFSNYSKTDGYMNCINHSIKSLCNSIEIHFNTFCQTNETNKKGYDFYNVRSENMQTLNEDLTKRYGIKIVQQKMTLPFLIVEKL